MGGVNVCACTSHMTLGINARVPQHGIKFLAIMNTAFNCLKPILRDSFVCPMVFEFDPFAVIQFFGE
ncbi:hypothetical protein BpHYR1_010192 [Brachionus plicatilis]|uniref:Uncharacterized protein n=1 Tax=Brachionus plicatilis TaxID=10195 RepID=A0A3M7RE99_BRAPC|nr:hypothetical protein BpHYR1_010192 [Brachionus plicatilis]